jgi:hypothetical protein
MTGALRGKDFLGKGHLSSFKRFLKLLSNVYGERVGLLQIGFPVMWNCHFFKEKSTFYYL